MFTVYDAKESPKDSVVTIETAEQVPRMCGERVGTGGIAIGAIRIEKEICRQLSEVEARVLTAPLFGSACHDETEFAGHNAVQQQSFFIISKTFWGALPSNAPYLYRLSHRPDDARIRSPAYPLSTRRRCLSLEPPIVPPRQGTLRVYSLDLRW